MWIYILIGIIIVLLIYIFVLYNSFVKLDNKANEAFSTMDVYLKKRWDLIPNIVEVVKGYSKHEKNTLEELVSLRNKTYDNMTNNEKIKTNESISNDISKIMVLAESYPELKASENFINLSKNLTKVEDEIANSRKYYNAVVRMFNNKVSMFPSNICAKIFGYKEKDMFEANSNERENVSINLWGKLNEKNIYYINYYFKFIYFF